MSLAPRLWSPLPDGFAATQRPGDPEITVVTASYQAAATIGETLESVSAQTSRDFEHLVIDGGSTDATCELVRSARHRPRLVSERDHGIYDAFNKGLALARGRWITFLNADDAYAHPRVLEAVLEHAAREPAVEVFHADQVWIDETGRIVGEARFVGGVEGYGFDLENPINHQTTFMAREVFARIGGFDATFALAGDYDLLLRAHLAGIEMRHVPEVFVRMRVGGRSQTGAELGTREGMRAWRRRTGRVPWRWALRYLRHHVIRERAPWLANALIAAKRTTIGLRRSAREISWAEAQRDATSSTNSRS